jgi:hypothetical protein
LEQNQTGKDGFSCMEINILIVSIYGNKLKSITQDTGQVALFVNIVSKSDGTLTIELPRIILDSKRQDNSDYTYQVMVDGKDASFEEKTKDPQARTLAIDFNRGALDIKISSKILTIVTAEDLVNNAIQDLRNGDNKGALVHLNLLPKKYALQSSSEIAKVLLNNTIRAIQSGDAKGALVHLNLAKQELVSSSNNIATTIPQTTPQIENTQANQPPKAYDYNTTINTGVPVRFALPSNDSENDPITFSIISNPYHGKIIDFSPDGGAVTYVSYPDYLLEL